MVPQVLRGSYLSPEAKSGAIWRQAGIVVGPVAPSNLKCTNVMARTRTKTSFSAALEIPVSSQCVFVRQRIVDSGVHGRHLRLFTERRLRPFGDGSVRMVDAPQAFSTRSRGISTLPSETKTPASLGDTSVSGADAMTEVAALVAQEPGDVKF